MKQALHDVAVADREANGDFGGRQNLREELLMLESMGWTIVPPAVDHD